MGKVGVCCEYSLPPYIFFYVFLPDAGWNLHLLRDCTALLTLPHLTSPLTSLLLFVYASFRRLFSSRPRFCLASPRFASPLLFKSSFSPLFFHLSFACNLFHRVVFYLAAVLNYLLYFVI